MECAVVDIWRGGSAGSFGRGVNSGHRKIRSVANLRPRARSRRARLGCFFEFLHTYNNC
jgi:hypothetical protein